MATVESSYNQSKAQVPIIEKQKRRADPNDALGVYKEYMNTHGLRKGLSGEEEIAAAKNIHRMRNAWLRIALQNDAFKQNILCLLDEVSQGRHRMSDIAHTKKEGTSSQSNLRKKVSSILPTAAHLQERLLSVYQETTDQEVLPRELIRNIAQIRRKQFLLISEVPLRMKTMTPLYDNADKTILSDESIRTFNDRIDSRVKQAQSAYNNAVTYLVTSNLPLAISVSGKHKGKGLSHIDLIQEANTGLHDAAESFAPEDYQTKFSTHATWCMYAQIMRALKAQRKQYQFSRMGTAKQVETKNITRDERYYVSENTVSSDTHSKCLDGRAELREAIRRAISCLPYDQRVILIDRYLSDNTSDEPTMHRVVAKKHGISRAASSMRERVAREKLLQSKELRELWESMS